MDEIDRPNAYVRPGYQDPDCGWMEPWQDPFLWVLVISTFFLLTYITHLLGAL